MFKERQEDHKAGEEPATERFAEGDVRKVAGTEVPDSERLVRALITQSADPVTGW